MLSLQTGVKRRRSDGHMTTDSEAESDGEQVTRSAGSSAVNHI